ncbi:alpha-ketoacid dehydrogenase subunit alpha/beta [Geoalkalibacter sp.]|uniref:alpha-ketoacid dehydrogenase subunit alpha/beta n=1 Tax=Geoalkalibacter sp. TaxID=3041440 RepID=UPI00272E7FE5|nr:alpha-ketoacid dehydrogenase subunit alpha/beta [Geoalkalibacter sp.]
MSSIKTLKPLASWQELRATPKDWDAASPIKLGSMLTCLHLIRAFEKATLDCATKGLVHGPVHSSIGQEGGAVGSILALKKGDKVNGSHRGHHQFLAKALSHVSPGGLVPTAPVPADVYAVLKKTLAEIMGLAQGYCKGRGGSMHLRWEDAGMLGTNAIVGGGTPMAAGVAWCNKRAGTDNVVVNYFGDGAANIGSVLETFNLAAAWKLPVCFFIENNHYAVSTAVAEVTGDSRLSGRGPGFNIPAWRVDGMDPLAVFLAMEEALAHMRNAKGPTLIEAEVYRETHHSGPMPGSAFRYRSKEEESLWKARDPLEQMEKEMLARKLITEEEIASLQRQAQDAMHHVIAELTEKNGPSFAIKADLWPKPDFCNFGIRGNLSEMEGLRTEELRDYEGKLREMKLVEAAAGVMLRRMETDERIVVMGEDVHRLGGGTNGVTKGIPERFPDRILGTPISENAFVGLGGGMAMDGRFRPVVELMYADFFWVAADQVFNQVAKARHMYGGDLEMPFVLRTKIAIGTGYGSQHSMDPAGVFAMSPGLRIVAPSTPFDYIGLMNSALACNDPVVVLEHVELYNTVGLVPEEDMDYFIPLGKAKVARSGKELTILTYLSMVKKSVEVAESLGIDAEVIDLRTLDRAGLDWDTIGASIQKTNNVLIVEQGTLGNSYGTMLGDEIQRRYMDWLDQPVKRVHGAEAWPSVSKVLEAAANAGQEEIKRELLAMLKDAGK